MGVFPVGLGNEGGYSMICNECETVAHCTKHGCVPKQPAPVQEPVGEVCGYYERGFDAEKTRYGKLYNQDLPLGIKLYTTPPAAQRQWVGLTDKERIALVVPNQTQFVVMKVVEAKLKEKNT
jgi:hypothetical protein